MEIIDDQQLKHRLESLQQENIVLKSEVETMKLKIRALQDENLQLRRNSVNIQVRAEQEEEYISNKLLKKITELKKEKETLALNYEQEEEYLTNDLTRKLSQLREEKANLEKTLEKEQEVQISKLMSRIQKLENDVSVKQRNLDTLRREKIELENALEQEQEGLVNRLWKKMEKLESEKRLLQSKLDVSFSPVPPSEMTSNLINNSIVPVSSGNKENDCEQMEIGSQNNQCSGGGGAGGGEDEDIESLLSGMSGGGSCSNVATDISDGNTVDKAGFVQSYIWRLREEVSRLRSQVAQANDDCEGRLKGMGREEHVLQEENRRLRQRLQAEMERRQEMCRNLSESESSLEIDEERQFNELRKCSTSGGTTVTPANLILTDLTKNRMRTTSDSSGCLMSSIGSASHVYALPHNHPHYHLHQHHPATILPPTPNVRAPHSTNTNATTAIPPVTKRRPASTHNMPQSTTTLASPRPVSLKGDDNGDHSMTFSSPTKPTE